MPHMKLINLLIRDPGGHSVVNNTGGGGGLAR